MKFILSILCLIGAFAFLHAGKTIGPVGNLIINSIYVCKNQPPGDEIKATGELINVDANGNKAFFMNATLKIPIDLTIEYHADVYKWEGGGWKKFYGVKGKFCVDFIKMFGKLWDKTRAQIKPPIVKSCPVPAGSYTLSNFQASSKVMTIPAIFYGRLQLVFKIVKNKKVLVCFQGEGDSQAPS